MKLVKLCIFIIMILSAFVNLLKGKQYRYDVEMSYNPLPREWKSNSITSHKGRIHHGQKYLAAQRAMHVSNTYENTSANFKRELKQRNIALGPRLRKFD